MHRHPPCLRAWLGTLAALTLVGATDARADTPPPAAHAVACQHEVLIAPRHELAAPLAARAAAGYSIAAVARPDATVEPRQVAVVLVRPAGIATRRVEIAQLVEPSLPDLEAALAVEARQGFVLRGITRTLEPFGPPAWVALLERDLLAADAPPRSYRLVRTLGNAEEWRRLESVAREGYAVVDALWWPDPTRSAGGEVVFVAERKASGAPPRRLELVWEPLEKIDAQLAKLAAQGYGADLAWTSRDYVNVLLSRAEGAPAGKPDRYEVDWDPGLPAVSSMSGRLVERLEFRDGQVAIYDRSGRGRYAIEWLALTDADLARPGVSPAGEALARRLDRHGHEGLCAFDAVLQSVPGRPRELLVLLRGEDG